MAQMTFIDVTDTTAERIHEHICDTAVQIGNSLIAQEVRIPKKWRGPALRNSSPYSGGGITLDIAEEYQGASENVKRHYRRIATAAIRMAIVQHQDLFAGLILGSAKAGDNYFNRWPQAPTQLF